MLEDKKKSREIELEKKELEKKKERKEKERREIEKQKKKNYYQWKKVDYEGKISIDCMKDSTHSECLSPNFFKTFNLVSLKCF